MHFDSVDQILAQLERQPGWEKFREYRQLLKCWDKTVNQKIAQHTRPLYINRQVLYIATSSAARAQELSFQRYALLKRLNKQLAFDLKDLRFSSSQWQQQIYQPKIQSGSFIFRKSQKYRVDPNPSFSLQPTDGTTNDKTNCISDQDQAKNAAQRWLKNIERRSLLNVFCPECNCSTSNEELARWNSCYHCIAQKWSEEYRFPNVPETK